MIVAVPSALFVCVPMPNTSAPMFDAQDRVDKPREELIAQIEGKLAQTTHAGQLFSIRWNLVAPS